MPQDNDQKLLEAARSGEKQALEKLLERHEAQVYRFGMQMCRDAEDAKDVLQDTLFAMARGVRDFRGTSSISTWLYTIARSFCIKRRRRSKFDPAEEHSLDARAGFEAAQVADPGEGPDEALAGRQVQRALVQSIDALEPMYREVLILRDVEGLTAPEVAEVLGVNTQTVKSRLHRARLAVRAHVAPLLGIHSELIPGSPAACRDVLTFFSKHLEGEISSDACAEMEQHIDGCPSCRGNCDSLKRTLALCRTAGAQVVVPASVQASVRASLRSFLDNNA